MSQQSSSSSLPPAPVKTNLEASGKPATRPKPATRQKPKRNSNLAEILPDEELKTEPAERQQIASQKDEEQEPATPRASTRRNSKNPDKDLKEEIRKLRLKVTELENKLEEFEEAKEEEHENLNQQVSDLTNELDTVTNER